MEERESTLALPNYRLTKKPHLAVVAHIFATFGYSSQLSWTGAGSPMWH